MRKVFLIFLICLLINLIVSKIEEKRKFDSKGIEDFGTLIIAYCSWGEADEKIIQAVEHGANVIIWFSIDLISIIDKEKDINTPFINDRNKNYQKIKEIMDKIHKIREVKHLLSIGGWNSPHITSIFNKDVWIDKLENYNIYLDKEYGVKYDGFDWDLEGNDDFKSEFNKFTVLELDLIGQISQGLKNKGYIMSMAPSESYFDIENNDFSLSLLNAPLWQQDFFYHGKNVYTYVYEKYKFTYSEFHKKDVFTFDFISIQLYEGYSRTFNYHSKISKFSNLTQTSNFSNKNIKEETIYTYLKNLILKLENGWEVNFSQEPSLNFEDKIVTLRRNNFVIGLANGWAFNSPKFLFLQENELIYAIKKLKSENLLPKGFMFWDIADEGTVINGKEYYLTKILSSCLKDNED